ncbi:MAG TPA: M56 family metallopeptidase, partial [Polyangiales bacterium]|nr:M56 family metallopeptidase [Polyangiales bacterium]
SGPLIVGRAEVCIPSGDLAGYSDAEVDAIFAHELAHLERRDGLWFPLVGFVEAVLWMQPFNRWVSTRFRQSAEMACDDRAIELTDAPMALARALTRMADTALAVRGRVLLPAMASHGSAHLERVHRLVVASTSRRNGGSPRVSRLRDRYTVLLCLSALGLAVPSVGVETARARPAPTRPRSVKSNTAAPDGALYDVTMTALTAEAHRLEDQLAADADTTDVFGARDAQPIELRQALRHVLETQAWTEHVYASELQAWEQREGAREPPSPAGQ